MDKTPMEVLEASNLEMGMNYLIADGVVYGVMVWAGGGIAYSQTWKPGDRDYDLRYKTAANNPHTIFKARS